MSLERQKLNYLPHCILYIGNLDGSIGNHGYEYTPAGQACCTSCGHVTRSFLIIWWRKPSGEQYLSWKLGKGRVSLIESFIFQSSWRLQFKAFRIHNIAISFSKFYCCSILLCPNRGSRKKSEITKDKCNIKLMFFTYKIYSRRYNVTCFSPYIWVAFNFYKVAAEEKCRAGLH